jgi:hypothetical protein
MLRFTVRPMALFNRLSNLPIAMFQRFCRIFISVGLLGNGGNEIAPAHCGEQRVGKRKGFANLACQVFWEREKRSDGRGYYPKHEVRALVAR